MSMIAKEEYLDNPCRISSIPYWKTAIITVPTNMRVMHHNDFQEELLDQFSDELYFRLHHDLSDLSAPVLPEGYSLCAAAVRDFAEHINGNYEDIGISTSHLQSYISRRVYDADLWLAVRDDRTGRIVATGLGELDREIGEGALEWIQVSEKYRGRGLGCYLVRELLWRMRLKAEFVTVSGRCSNPSVPENLYRKCGFSGNDVWHVMTKRGYCVHL